MTQRPACLRRGRLERAFQGEAHVADVAHSLLAVFLQAAAQHGDDSRRHGGRQRRPVRIALQHRREHVRQRLAGEDGAARQHLEDHDAEGPHVAAFVDRFSGGLLGAHVGSRAENDSRLRHRRRRDGEGVRGVRRRARRVRVEGFRQTKIEHFHGAVGADFNIGGLQIAVDDVLLMRGFERLRDLLRDRQRLVEWNRATRDALRQIVALDEFHHEG
jgi:hypothetical protein